MNQPAHVTRHDTLLARIGIETPIIQAPMAGVSTPAMAAGVSNAGGLGSLGIGAMDVDAARKVIRDTRALTDRPFNINVFCHRPATPNAEREAAWLAYLASGFAEFGATPPASLREIYTSFVVDEAMFAMLLEERPAVVSFHFGVPDAAWIRALHEQGIVLMGTATNVDEARTIAAAGIDAIVAQGIEAGGHRGVFDPAADDPGLGTMALVRLLVRAVDLPIVAAGGIMDGAGIAAALALGAQAAQLGTAFVACPESSAEAPHRAALLSKQPVMTAMTRAISGRNARGLPNRLTALGSAPECPPIPDYPIAYDAAKALHGAAKAHGNSEFAAYWAGQAAMLSRSLPAGELVGVLRAELTQAIEALAMRITGNATA
jgi:nitronate monooxygenase